MDSKDRSESNLPAVPLRFTTSRPAVLDHTHPGRQAAEEPARNVNFVRAAFRAVTRHWWQILLLWACATGGLCYLISTRVLPVYESVSMLKVEPTRKDIFGTGMYGNESFMPFMETQVQLVLSPNVLSTVLSDPRVTMQPSLRGTADAEATLRSLVKVAMMPNSYLLRVSMTSTSSTECAVIVNSVVQAYLKAAAEWADGMTRAQIKSLESYQRELQAQADEKQESWLALAAKGNIELQAAAPGGDRGGTSLPVPTRNRVTLDEYKRVRDELFRVNVQLAEAEALEAMREQEFARMGQLRPAQSRGGKSVDKLVQADPSVRQLVYDIDKAKLKYEGARRLVRNPGGDPSTTEALRKLNTLKAQYAGLVEEKREEILAQLQEQTGDVDPSTPADLREAREKVLALKASKVSYEKMLSQIEVTNRQEGSDQVKVLLVREALTSIKQMEEAVNKRLEQLRFESKGEARVSKVSDARANGIPLADNRSRLLAITPVGVLAILVGLFAMLEIKIGRVSDLDEISKVIPTEVFAMPPLPGPRLEAGQRGARERESQLLEFLQSLDHLRVALCETPTAAATGRCIVVTSATESEGKTTLSAQLAACCAKAGMSTLLVDADMRRCTLSRMLNEEKSKGLSDVLQGEITPDEAALAIADAGFHLLPAGSSGRDPSWLLKGQGVSRMLSRYRQLFDMIIIDTPPVLPVPDALTLGRWCDGAILATRFDFSRMALVMKARRRMNSAGISVLKTVVNGVRTSRFYYGYGSSYGYGSYGGYGGYGAYTSAEDRQPQPPGQTSTTA